MMRRLSAVAVTAFVMLACSSYVHPVTCNVAEKACPATYCKWLALSVEGDECRQAGVGRNREVCVATSSDECVPPPEIMLQNVDCTLTSVAFVDGPGACPANLPRFEATSSPLIADGRGWEVRKAPGAHPR